MSVSWEHNDGTRQWELTRREPGAGAGRVLACVLDELLGGVAPGALRQVAARLKDRVGSVPPPLEPYAPPAPGTAGRPRQAPAGEEEYRTRTGRVLREAELDALAGEAEHGYDLESP